MKKTGKKRAGDWLIGVLLVLLVAVFVISVWKLLTAKREYDAGSEIYMELAETAVTPEKPPIVTESKEEPPVENVVEEPEEEPYVPLLDVDFEALRAVNPRTVAWLQSQDGEIDYPVVQGDDNSYYLSHLIDGTENRNGSICVRRRGTTARPLKSDTSTAENRHPFRRSDSWRNWRGDRHDVSPHAVCFNP